MSNDHQDPSSPDDFARQADQPEVGFLRQLIDFLAHNKKWWLAPIILMLLAIGLLVTMSGTALAPFLYTLF